ncbi:hypothetical protein [Armatimonas sp.]|uniref:hypothetical protein n=1 Tax=Armatimonas sp. TaxID=1872638 RepID=UPI00286A8B7B|nr:hypothetical protein [Armatimonas sp.]
MFYQRFAPIASVLCTLNLAHTDSCVFAKNALTSNTRFILEIQLEEDRSKDPLKAFWSYTLTERISGKKYQGRIPQLEYHAHPTVYLSEDGKRFAILDPIADHRDKDRFIVFTQDGKQIISLGINDILNMEEQSKVTSSISHIRWLSLNENTIGLFSKADNTVTLTTMLGRKVAISLTNGKIVKPVER